MGQDEQQGVVAMKEPCPNCGTEIQSRTKLCPNCEHSLASPLENKAAQEQSQGQETAEPGRPKTHKAPQEGKPPKIESETTEQQVDPAPEEPSSLDIRASGNGLLPTVCAIGGILGVAVILLVGAALPTAIILVSPVGPALKIAWLIAVGLVLLTFALFKTKDYANFKRTSKKFDTRRQKLPVEDR